MICSSLSETMFEILILMSKNIKIGEKFVYADQNEKGLVLGDFEQKTENSRSPMTFKDDLWNSYDSRLLLMPPEILD